MKKIIMLSVLLCGLSTLVLADTLSSVDLKIVSGTTGWSFIHKNTNLMGNPLKVDGKEYKTGLAAHAVSEIVYAIPQNAERFTVTGGIDDFVASEKAGSVVLRIEAGRDVSYLKELAKSPKLTGKGQRSFVFDVPLPKDAKVLQLCVEDGGDGNRKDHVDWIAPEFHGTKKLIPRKVKVAAKRPSVGAKPEGPLPYWNDVSVVGINRLPPRAHFIAYPNEKLAAKGGWHRDATPFRKSLNGTWKFRYSPTPKQRPKDFYKTDCNVSKWNEIPVPMNWQLAGYGIPIYNNSTFPFNNNPPYIDQSFNPVGSYKRTFKVPHSWKDHRVLIHFAGVDSAFTLWVNGREVGYSEGSRTPAEFDITKFLKKGRNDLAVEVIRFSSGAWLEDQDFWRLSGIFRDVELICEPAGERLEDFALTTPLTNNYTDAVFKLKCKIAKPAGGSVSIKVRDANGKIIISERKKIASGKVEISVPVKAPKLWSAEEPNLYNLMITHLDANGKTVEAVPQEFGFCRSEIKNNRLLVNGRPVVIAGVNRHEHSPTKGHYCSPEAIRRDIITMKKLNFNAIRTCHYANAPELYELANEYGMYINDEANIESHGNQQIPNMPDMAASHHHRMQRMVERDKNFTSVITWSLGNESGSGGAHNDNYTWTKAHDHRPIGYQRHGQNKFTDINTAFYRTPYSCASYARSPASKLMIQSEYAHAMGNSSGNLREYWSIYWPDNNVQGGFVWDWKDQGLQLPVPELSHIRIPGTDAENILVEGRQLSSEGLRGIMYFCHGSEPNFGIPYSVKIKMRTAPKSDDGLAFFPLFSRDARTGGFFLERNHLVFQTFGYTRNKLIAPLPDDFFDGYEQALLLSVDRGRVTFYCNGQKLRSLPLKEKLRGHNHGYVAFGPGVGTALVPERIEKNAPVLLSAKLYRGAITPEDSVNIKPVISLDFTKPVEVTCHRKAGGHFFAYGGYWENRRGHMTPGNFCMNGVVDASGKPHPGGYAFKYVQQPLETKLIDAKTGTISIHNRNYFKTVDSEGVIAKWQVTANGKIIKSGILDNFAVKAQQTIKRTLPIGSIPDTPGVEHRLQVLYELAADTKWAPAGHRIAWDGFQLSYNSAPANFADELLASSSDGNLYAFSGKGFTVIFDKQKGALISYKVNGAELLDGPLTPDFWRGTTDNDRAYGQANLVDWKAVESLSNATFKANRTDDNTAVVAISGDAGKTGAKVAEKFTIHGDGQIEVKVDYTPPVKIKKGQMIPRFGLRVALKNDMEQIKWYGRGPRETYIDRNYELIGRYHGSVDSLYTAYSRPQEYGNLHEVREAVVSNGKQAALIISATPENPLNISLRRFKGQTLEKFKYDYQLPPSGKIYLNIDGRVNAVAGDNTWGARPLTQYQLQADKPMSYSFTLRAAVN